MRVRKEEREMTEMRDILFKESERLKRKKHMMRLCRVQSVKVKGVGRMQQLKSKGNTAESHLKANYLPFRMFQITFLRDKILPLIILRGCQKH